IPSATGRFTIKPTQGNKVHTGELITAIVASERLIDPAQLGPRAMALPREKVDSWEKSWGAPSMKYEMQGGAGTAMTQKEQVAGADSSEELNQDDPVPQTVYRVAIKPSNPMIVSVALKFRR